jgi:hypothetical protein
VAVTAQDWRTASREPTGVAPDPKLVREAVVQVYGARTVGVKGYFGVHLGGGQAGDAAEWTVYEVIGWRLRYQDTALVVQPAAPDGRWFGAEPELYADKRGAGVDELIKRIDRPRAAIRMRASTASGRDRTRIRSLPGSHARCRSWKSTCRRRRSARTICAAPSSPAHRAAAATSFLCAGCSASPRARSKAWS